MNIKPFIAGAVLSTVSSAGFSEVLSIEFTNLTHGNHFTPLFFSAHGSGTHFFEVGTSASSEIQTMAEGGSTAGLVTQASGLSLPYQDNPAGGLLAPGSTTSIDSWDVGDNDRLSITGMILPTNDGFVGIDSWPIPDTAGTYTVFLNAYDAGTEANDEIVNGGGASGTPGIPIAPSGDNGENATGVTTEESNASVHIHRGVLGDTDAEGGVSDLDSRIHRWLNPVARMIVTVE